MPFSESVRQAKLKADLSQTKPSIASAGLLCEDQRRPDNDLVELVWENGLITTQGQSSRSKVPGSSNFPSVQPVAYDDKASISKTPKFGVADSIFHDFSLPAESCQIELERYEDLVPWFRYMIREPEPEPEPQPLQNDFCSEFLQDLSSLTVNELSSVNDLVFVDKKSSFDQITRNADANTAGDSLSLLQGSSPKASLGPVEVNKVKPTEAFPGIQLQHSMLRSGVSDISGNKASNTNDLVCRDSNYDQSSARDFVGVRLQRHEAGQPSCSSGFFNFPRFSRPVAMVQAALQRTNQPVGSVLNISERLVKENQGCATASSSNPPESTIGNLSSLSLLQREGASCNQPKMTPNNMISELSPSKPSNEPLFANQSSVLSRKEVVDIDNLPNVGHGDDAGKAVAGGEKSVVLAVPASSECSGNSLERASNDPKQYLKRKFPEAGDSEGPSEEVEGESVGVRKAVPACPGAKKTRVAEVHNLSERRRRDRINEKMRALQELIPNCNKADKASMLDEAIEYLKTLQLQVQMLSMGAGTFMPPMMFPAGMQYMHGPCIPPFSPVAFGMGMGMGFGMNMLDMNGGIMPVAPIQGVHYPVPGHALPGSRAFHGMAGPSLQAFGHPGQGLPVMIPRMPLLQMPGGPSLRLPMGANVPCMIGSGDASRAAAAMSSKELLQNDESQVPPDENPQSLENQVLNEGIQHSDVLNHIQAVKISEARKLASGNNDASS